jgi:hypothetical protein
MPSPQTLKTFIERVESGAHANVIEDFYTLGASMQENEHPPRVGRDVLIENERRILARARNVRSRSIGPAFCDGDFVVIRWVFEFEWLDGSTTRLEELAYQRWEGERIAQEKFFFDPAQMSPKRKGAR